MELGVGQEGVMFVYVCFYEDLIELEDGVVFGDSFKEGVRGFLLLFVDMCQISQDFSELSIQLMGVVWDLQEEMLLGSFEDWLDFLGVVG